jgi:hypothetical protein
MWKRAGKRSSLAWERGHEEPIREELQEDSRSSMYKVFENITYVKRRKKTECHELPILYLLMFDHAILDYSMFIFPNIFLLIVYFSAG